MDIDNHPKFTADLERVEVLESPVGGAGAVARLHYKDGTVMEDHLEVCQRGHLYRSRVEGSGMHALVETRLFPVAGGTRVRITWEGRADSLIGRMVLSLVKKRIRKRALYDLLAFKRLIEKNGPHFANA